MSNPYPICKRCGKRKKRRATTHTVNSSGYYNITVAVGSRDICASCRDYLLGVALAAVIEEIRE